MTDQCSKNLPMEVYALPRKQSAPFDEKKLTKGQLRKLNALRKSLGTEIADKAFAEWLKKIGSDKIAPVDQNVELVAEALSSLIKNKKLKVPRGGFLVTRWRDKIIVKPAVPKK